MELEREDDGNALLDADLAEEDAVVRRRVCLTTGNLTRVQAETVERWVARLAEDRPLPGVEKKGPGLRQAGLDDRPRASLSNVLAAAVIEFLDTEPSGTDIAVFSARLRKRRGRQDGPDFRPRQFHLWSEDAAVYERAAFEAPRALEAFRRELRDRARAAFPGEQPEAVGRRNQHLYWLLGQEGIPLDAFGPDPLNSPACRVPSGVVARMAIERWSRRKVDIVIGEAVNYAERRLWQPHRARRDIRQDLADGLRKRGRR
ncbi:hypothetical protein GCM10022221_68730 [Actinocorallia aurea]